MDWEKPQNYVVIGKQMLVSSVALPQVRDAELTYYTYLTLKSPRLKSPSLYI